MNSSKLLVAVILLLLIGASACGSNQSVTNSETPATPQTQSPIAGFPNLGDISRQGSFATDKFHYLKNGADFATDIAFNSCAANGTFVDFTPTWAGTGTETLSDAAFCVYRLKCDPLAAPNTLTLTWNTMPPLAGTCWLGLSDWTTNTWMWQPMPLGGQLAIADPTRISDSAKHCYVAVVVLGDTNSTLTSIDFGGPFPTDDGYTLIAPLNDTKSYLLDMDGTVVHDWTAQYTPGAAAHLLPNGHLMRMANMGNAKFTGGGTGGRITEFDWDGNIVWYHNINSNTQCSHHSFCMLPNGNILIVVWELIPDATILAAGRDPATLDAGNFQSDAIFELEPILPNGANVVWEWHATDHLIQDFDMDDGNFGDPAEHPELINVNYPPQDAGDWIHINCVAYNAERDQLIVTTPFFNEIWVIDHTTTTVEAAGHTGGACGKGGDLLYRWGNPAAYNSGTAADKQLYFCHDAHWIPEGLDGAGELMVFNNRAGTPFGQNYSSVIQIIPPQLPDGNYDKPGQSYGPAAPDWEWISDPAEDFYSPIVSSAQRLPAGGTLICAGASGHIFQINAAGEVVWEYQNAFPTGPTAPVFRADRYTVDYPGVEALQ